MESEHVNINQNLEIKHEDSKHLVDEASIHSVSSSSSSSSSSSEELDSNEKSSVYDSPAKSEFEANKSSSPKSVSSPETIPQWSMTSTSPPPPEQMKSPPVQTMGQQQQHPPGYDPNRIPISIFSTKPSNPAEWSTASNESLFSIHMGNNSFTSGEPFWLDDWNNSQLNQQNGSETKPNQVSSLPPVMEVPAHEETSVRKPDKGQKLEREDSDISLKEEKMIYHSPPEIVHAASTNVAKPAVETQLNSSSKHRLSSSNPRLSDDSGNSSSSFAFPVLVNDGGKPGSFHVVAEKHEKPQLQPHESKAATPKASEIRWFSCLCCWPRCC